MEDYSAPKKMKLVGDLFKKYQTLFKPPQESVEIACVGVIKKITGFDIPKESVAYTVNTKVISLNLPSVLKTEIKFKHKDILQELRKQLGNKNAPETIF